MSNINYDEYLNKTFGDMKVIEFTGLDDNYNMRCKIECTKCGNIKETQFTKIKNAIIGLQHSNKYCQHYLELYDDNIGLTVNDYTIIKMCSIDKNGYRYITKCNICGANYENYLHNFKRGYGTRHHECSKHIPSSKYNKRFKKIWDCMIYRTTNPKYKEYYLYGGRGINSNYFSDFMIFYKTMFEEYVNHCEQYGEGNTSLDRKDTNGNYEPNNCRWSTIKEQANNKRNNRYITINKNTKTLKEWCDYLKLSYAKVSIRLNKYNWSIEEALEIIPRNKNKTTLH